MLEPAQLLAVWEAGLSAKDARVQRATLLHGLVRQENTVDELLGVPIGDRDRDLFALRRRLFGDRLPVRLSCMTCDEELEFDVDVATMRSSSAMPEPFVEG